MTREEFIDKWVDKLNCLALTGAISEERDGDLAKAKRWRLIPDLVNKILNEQYDNLCPPPKPAIPPPPKAIEPTKPPNGTGAAKMPAMTHGALRTPGR